ncbi:gluconeogenesis factor YvcK family protein [Maledivibacter halophilus]|uniref:Putative gluconeogenesis factor n=1 Tax=Maledivibacter halophilus TaxID=36842 RepID=A0A1T5JK17_9FIRM|nr:YvcK family protein [Maledivibacter halophilus]SKC51749.1 conserved hypothetical protein, cofD-related [Maledivibacter halophilus]
MNIFFWLKPGIKIKRWIILVLFGITLITIGIKELFDNNIKIILGDEYIIPSIMAGIILVIISAYKGGKRLATILVNAYSNPVFSGWKNANNLYDNSVLDKGLKVVVIGGGTGLSVLLRGLKRFTSNITAIVTVADDGGGSGKLREDLGMLPPGDIRNCILALADTEPLMEKLLQYRFEEGTYKNQSFGNLLIAAMAGISDSFEDAIKRINDIFAVAGKVVPVTTQDITLYAKLANGKIIKGESQIPIKSKELDSPIENVFLKPKKIKPVSEAKEALIDADVIILGPGSLYTSILPNLIVEDITKMIEKSSAVKVYVSNVMTQPGETDGYSVADHVKAIIDHTGEDIIEYVYANNKDIPEEISVKYKEEGAKPVKIKEENKDFFKNHCIKLIQDNYIEVKKGYLRHDALKLSEAILEMVINKRYNKDKIRFFELNSIMKKVKNNKI